MSRHPLTDTQKRRLLSASTEALSKRQQWHVAQVQGVGRKRLDEMRLDMMVADSRFATLMRARGLCVGDTVRIVVVGPFLDVEVEILEIESDGDRFRAVRPDGGTVVPLPHEVVLVAAKGRH